MPEPLFQSLSWTAPCNQARSGGNLPRDGPHRGWIDGGRKVAGRVLQGHPQSARAEISHALWAQGPQPRTVTGFFGKSHNTHCSHSQWVNDRVGTTHILGILLMNTNCSHGKFSERTWEPQDKPEANPLPISLCT